MFNRIFIEKEVYSLPRSQKILNHFKKVDFQIIDQIDHYFGRVKKPYLQKRDNLNLFIGKKRGQLVKEAPDAYGLGGDPHYYFIHAYNCIYECEYCYLQGYFNSPDLVFFVNHEEIGEEIKKISSQAEDHQSPWFHAGEFSDSLALSHITQEVKYYIELFRDLPKSRLELRTKSVNIKELLNIPPAPNVYISYSLSPQKRGQKSDKGCPSTDLRIKAMVKLAEAGHKLAVHLDPIIWDEDFEKDYSDLIFQLLSQIPAGQFSYISLGVVRFTKDVYRQMAKNYPDSDLLAMEFITPEDGKVRYPRPVRKMILNRVSEMLLSKGLTKDQVYLCMED